MSGPEISGRESGRSPGPQSPGPAATGARRRAQDRHRAAFLGAATAAFVFGVAADQVRAPAPPPLVPLWGAGSTSAWVRWTLPEGQRTPQAGFLTAGGGLLRLKVTPIDGQHPARFSDAVPASREKVALQVDDLHPRTLYAAQVLRVLDPTGVAGPEVFAQELVTGEPLALEALRVRERTDRSLVLTWTSSVHTFTSVRVAGPLAADQGPGRDYDRIVLRDAPRRSTQHRLVLNDLEPEATYQVQAMAIDPTDPARRIFSAPVMATTRKAQDPFRRHLDRWRHQIRLDAETKNELALGSSTARNFFSRLSLARRWITQLRLQGAALPAAEGAHSLDDEVRWYLKSLYEVNRDRALDRLDAILEAVANAEGYPRLGEGASDLDEDPLVEGGLGSLDEVGEPAEG